MDLINSKIAQLHGAVVSMQGGRPENQDDYGVYDTPLGCLIIVCDGMGGGPGGKTASYIVKYEIAQSLMGCSSTTPKDYALKKAVEQAHQALERKMQEVPSLAGMGSTFVAVLVNPDSIYVAHAGDSRCYKLKGKKVVYRSADHSLVAELVRKKALTEEEARTSPQSNIISRGLGSVSNHVPEIEEISYKKGDRIVLCTDGVWGIMPEPTLIARFSSVGDISTTVTNISQEIDKIGFAEGGFHDNHTLAIIDMDVDSNLAEKKNWRKTALISVVGVVTAALLVVGVSSILSHCSNDSHSSMSSGSGGYAPKPDDSGSGKGASAEVAFDLKELPKDKQNPKGDTGDIISAPDTPPGDNSEGSGPAPNGTPCDSDNNVSSKVKSLPKDYQGLSHDSIVAIGQILDLYDRLINLQDSEKYQNVTAPADSLKKKIVENLDTLRRNVQDREVCEKLSRVKKETNDINVSGGVAKDEKANVYRFIPNIMCLLNYQKSKLQAIKNKWLNKK